MKKQIPFLFLFILSIPAFSQKEKVKNLQQFDVKTVHFGFSLGVNTASFGVYRNPIQTQDSLNSIKVIPQSGFNLGIVSELHFNQYFGLRFLPTLVFGQRNLEFNFSDINGKQYTRKKIVESTYLDFPFLFKYRSARLNNFAAYVIAGGKYTIDLASNEDVKNDEIPESIIKLKKNTYNAEVGVGTDFFLPYFKFAIELKMSYSLDDAIIHDNTELSTPIQKIMPKMFFITFLFEG